MKIKSFILILLSFLAILISCKKDKKSSPHSTSNPYTASQGYDAQVYSFRERIIGGGISDQADGAKFYSAMVYPGTSDLSVDAGTVSINNTILGKTTMNPSGPSYVDTSSIISSSSYTLNVSGTSQFPAGVLVYGQNYPVFTDTMLVPTSVSLSSGLSLQFNNCLNADTVLFFLQDHTGRVVLKKYGVSANQVSITFSPAELNTLSTINHGSLWVELWKQDIVTVGTKTYAIYLTKRYAQLGVPFN